MTIVPAICSPSANPVRRMPGGHRRAVFWRVLVLGLPALLPGCYNGSTLVEARHEETNLVRLDEIDIGEFRITLPRSPGAPGGGVVEFHAFGQVALRDRDKVAKALELNRPEMRYRVLLLVRALERKDLDEPKLEKLRTDIANLANAALDKRLVKNVGFYSFSFTAM